MADMPYNPFKPFLNNKAESEIEQSGITASMAKKVSEFHVNDDLDAAKQAHHHTLGIGPTQAAAGDHLHTGVYEWSLNHREAIRTRLTDQSIPNNAFTQVNFGNADPEGYQNGLQYDGVGVWTGMVTAGDEDGPTSDGIYIINYALSWEANLTGRRIVRLIRGAGTEVQRTVAAPAPDTGGCTTAGTWIGHWDSMLSMKLEVYQNSGGALNLLGGVGTFNIQMFRLKNTGKGILSA